MAIAQDGALRFDFSGSNMYNPAFINIRVQICVPGADFEFQDPELSIQNCRTAPPRCCRTAPPQLFLTPRKNVTHLLTLRSEGPRGLRPAQG